jgi:hypothetical protein
MVYFHTKNPNFGESLGMENVGIYGTFVIYYGHLT